MQLQSKKLTVQLRVTRLIYATILMPTILAEEVAWCIYWINKNGIHNNEYPVFLVYSELLVFCPVLIYVHKRCIINIVVGIIL